MLCPDVVGRARETAALRARIADLERGHGGVVVLVGNAGMGKSRLLADVAAAAARAGAVVLSGRAVPGTGALAYRPLSEAFATAFRNVERPPGDAFAGLAAYVGRLVPQWADDDVSAEGESPVVLGEATIRLLRSAGSGGPAVLLLEDLHWGDAETLAVVDYLADALSTEAILCVCTTRMTFAGERLIERVRRRDPAAVLAVEPLAPAEVDTMVAACLGVPEAPAGLDGFIRTHSDGVPFVVEELLAGLIAAGELTRDGSHWVIGELRAAVPASLRSSIHRRFVTLDAEARQVLTAAALLGRQFDWELLPGVAEVDGRAVGDALRAAIGAQLVETDGDGFRFRHALTREAVLGELLAPERRELARRAWPAVERANPGLPGPWCEIAAELAEAAGEPAAAAQRLVRSARGAFESGALVTAEATARKAMRLGRADPATTVDAEETLIDVLVAAGKASDAIALGGALTRRMAGAGISGRRVADLHLTVARAAITTGDRDTASENLGAARAIVNGEPDAALAARVDALAAHVALDGDDLDGAGQLAERARAGAVTSEQPAVECDAMIVLGRVARVHNWAEGMTIFERATVVAATAHLPTWHLRAAWEWASVASTYRGVDSLREVRELARRYGAVETAAVLDLILADLALAEFDTRACQRAAVECVDAATRYRLAIRPVAQLWLAGGHALAGDVAAMRAAVDAAISPDPDDARILADLHGRVLVVDAIVNDRLDDVPALLDTMAEHVARAGAEKSVFPGRALQAVVQAVVDHPGAAQSGAVVAQLAAASDHALFVGATYLVEAIEAARAGDIDRATQVFAAARGRLLGAPVGPALAHCTALFVAPSAQRDGWGEPVAWLRAAEAFFAGLGHARVARRCRLLLGQIGAPMPRQGRGDSAVPASLRALGITSREVDVLKLVAAGSTNRAIADELLLSPKTVERHLSSLFTRAGVANRRELAALAATHLDLSDH